MTTLCGLFCIFSRSLNMDGQFVERGYHYFKRFFLLNWALRKSGGKLYSGWQMVYNNFMYSRGVCGTPNYDDIVSVTTNLW